MTCRSLRARIVFPIDAAPIVDGVVVVDGQQIQAVGASDAAAGENLDLGNVALLPGLVNAHTHLEFSHLNRPLGEPDMELADWIRLILSERNRRSFRPRGAIGAGCRESLARGVTTVADIATVGATCYPTGSASPRLTLLQEVIGFSRARAESALAAVKVRLAEELPCQSHPVGLSPHAPYTVSPRLLQDLVELAAEHRLPVAMHVAESRAEIELLASGTGPLAELLRERSMWDEAAIPADSRPLDYLRLLLHAPRALVIHGNYLSDDEFEFLATHRDRLSLVHCARTHRYFRHSKFPLARCVERGVRVALGTDSRASNPDLCLLSEMRAIAQAHQEIDLHDVLRMGTLSAAEALGRAREIGSLSPGKMADVIAVPLPEDAAGDSSALLACLLARNMSPRVVLLGGQPIETDAGGQQL